MGNNLRPIGSEKLQGMDKIQRIMEIAKYNENIPTPINESTSVDYNKTLADGRNYQIIKEKNGYVIKRSLLESTSEVDYLEPMKNRKYYSSYSQAFKRLNLIAKEVNVNEGQEANVNLFYENDATKYILKMKGGETEEQAPAPAPAPAPAAAPAPAPSPAPAPAPEPEDEFDIDDAEEIDLGDDEMDAEDDEIVTLKVIQKLTGKLAQKLRAFEDAQEDEPMTSKDIKYVINSILSALDLESLDEEDKEEIMNKFEGIEADEELGGDDMDGEDLTDDSEVEDIQADMDVEPEMGEGFMYDDVDDDNPDDFDFEEEDELPSHPRHRRLRPHTMKDDHANHLEDMFEGMFTESKVDEVLRGYFKIDQKEKQLLENKKQTQSLIKEERKNKISKIKQISESISQEVASTKLITKYPGAKLVGKTNKHNLVFEMNNKQLRVNTKGEVL